MEVSSAKAHFAPAPPPNPYQPPLPAVIPLEYGHFVLETFVGFIASSIFTIVWGWYKVLLPSAGRAAAIKKADLVHNVFRVTCIVANMVGGILGTVLLPEKYKGTGVYLGNVHAVLRTIIFVLVFLLTIFTRNLGINIKNEVRQRHGQKIKRYFFLIWAFLTTTLFRHSTIALHLIACKRSSWSVRSLRT
jgi:hypothetical protein